jgi:hypothetical protein
MTLQHSFDGYSKGRSNILDMSLSSLSYFGNNTCDWSDKEESASICYVNLFNQFMIQCPPRRSHPQTNSGSTSQHIYDQQQFLLGPVQSNSTTPNHSLQISVTSPLKMCLESSNISLCVSNGNPNEAKNVFKRVDRDLNVAESVDFQGSNYDNSNISERLYSPIAFFHNQCVDNETVEYDSLVHKDDTAIGTSVHENRFSHDQADQWTTMLEKLKEFRRQRNHCIVAHTSKEFPALGRWVKRQRYQYKLMLEGNKASTMTPERAQILEEVGFAWDAHTSIWERRFRELHDFYVDEGHCNVPSNFPPNPQLSTWVKFQRRQYKALRKGKRCCGRSASGQSLTPTRIRALQEMGFQWELRRSRRI